MTSRPEAAKQGSVAVPLSNRGIRRRFLLIACLFPCLPAWAQFHRVELTRDDVISIYKVPLDDKPTVKFEWTVDGEKYFRVVVEQASPGKRDWKIRSTYPLSRPVHRAVFSYQIADRHVKGLDGNYWRFSIRLGGESAKRSGWEGSEFELPVRDPYFTESDNADPDKLFLLKTPDRLFRLRLEVSDRPFVDP